ncbi:MAG: hydantoinase/oxoprolinase family protein [Acidimicrobiales bacterium]
MSDAAAPSAASSPASNRAGWTRAGRAGADAGGTFTDVVTSAGRAAKVLSSPADPGAAVRRGLAAAGLARPATLAHGSTVATNALLERRGAAVALVTNEGFEDAIEIARQDRPSLYDQWADRTEPLVPRRWRYGAAGRLDAHGRQLVPVAPGRLAALDPAVEAVAVCLLHADLNPAHELALRAELVRRGHDVSCSHEVSPEFREYERLVTTVINAYLRPRCRAYLEALADAADEVLVMTSAGGVVPAADGAARPAALLLSGPAAGVYAAAAAAAANGFPDAITFDMGGTSTDVCLVQAGRPAPAGGRTVGGFPVRLPSLDVHTIGAGGGSIARLDAGGALVVGPESAGADPGPACYGRGGRSATVTDANLAAGRIPADAAFGDLGRLDAGAAAAALARAGVGAEGVLAVVDANMEQALRAVSVERGVDPRGLALVAFGGAGPLHACGLAEALGMPAVVVPARAGVLSAVGLLCSPVRRDVVRSWPDPLDHHGLEAALGALAAEAEALAGPGAVAAAALDCRYRGQSHELTVASVAEFHEEHRRRNGYARPDEAVEVVALRASAERPAEVELAELAAPARRGAVGPFVLAEPDCTIWIPDGWRAEPGANGDLVVQRR